MLQEVMNFVTVLVVAMGIASCIGVMYASGLRLWAKGAVAQEKGGSYLTARICSVICFTACVVVVLFALWLIIPYFHQG